MTSGIAALMAPTSGPLIETEVSRSCSGIARRTLSTICTRRVVSTSRSCSTVGGSPPGRARWDPSAHVTAISVCRGCLSRADTSPFTAEDATQALHAVRCALSLILGRRADVVLLVGWKHEQPVWARWTAGQVDTFREPGTWLDASVAAAQAGEVAARFLDCWPDSLRSDKIGRASCRERV